MPEYRVVLAERHEFVWTGEADDITEALERAEVQADFSDWEIYTQVPEVQEVPIEVSA